MTLLRELISRNKILQTELNQLNNDELDLDISGISSNSKNIKEGYIFIAIKGIQFDGCKFIQEARKNGAVLIIAEEIYQKNVVSIKKESSREIYALLAASYYKNQPQQIIGVTGTNGKTSVVEFCRQIWSQAGWKAASMGTLGTKFPGNSMMSTKQKFSNNLTTFEPSDLYNELNIITSQEISHVAIEASSHGIDQYRLEGVNFSGAVFTNLSQDHFDYHKTMENYFSVKKRLFTKIIKNNSAVAINIDDDHGELLYNELKKLNLLILTFGKNLKADIKIKSITHNSNSINLEVIFNNTTFLSTIGMIGEFQVYNVLASASICIALGMDANFVFKSLSYLRPVPGRMQIVSEHPSEALIIIDYAHSPDALFSVLNSLRGNVKGRIITLFGCGGNRDKTKRKIMGQIASENSDEVIVTDDNPRTEQPSNIRKEILIGCPNAIEIAGRNNAIKYAVAKLKKNDLLLIAGKGHESFQTIGTESLPFDDFTVAKEAIKNLNKNELRN